MSDGWVADDDWESILRSPERIAADVQGPTPNEVALLDLEELDPVSHSTWPKPPESPAEERPSE